MYSHALGERAESKIAVVEAMATMEAKLYQITGPAMHFPKDKRRLMGYQCRWCGVQPIIKHQYDLVGYSLASLLNSYGGGHIIFVHNFTLTKLAVRTIVQLSRESEFKNVASSCFTRFTLVLGFPTLPVLISAFHDN